MPIISILELLYREFCRARLSEMRRQFLLRPGTPVVPEENCEAGHPDDASDRRSSQECDNNAQRSLSGHLRSECPTWVHFRKPRAQVLRPLSPD
jgi:hypothetical protein